MLEQQQQHDDEQPEPEIEEEILKPVIKKTSNRLIAKPNFETTSLVLKQNEFPPESVATASTMGRMALTIPKGDMKAATASRRAALDAAANEEEEEEEQDDELLTPAVEFIDGKIVVNASSVTVESKVVEDKDDCEEVFENSAVSTGCGFPVRKMYEKWTDDQVREFYSALQQVGTDFSAMSALFPCRTRRELKIKFKREERLHPKLIDLALHSNATFDDTALQQMLRQVDKKKKSSSR